MDETIEDIVESGCLEIELLFIEFEYKMNQLFIKKEKDNEKDR
jgi:hypothetical protein|tara:strand:- start:626 stop:754 length:129 start_codon:yes stop_codon:yes gene_type:complete